MGKRQKLLLGVAVVLGLVALGDYLARDSEQPAPARAQSGPGDPAGAVVSRPRPAPEPASLSDFIDATNKAGEVISQRDAKLKQLSFDLQESELEAKIAQNRLTQEKARLDLEMQEAEISRIKAEAEQLRQLDRMSEAARSRADSEPSVPPSPRFDPLLSMPVPARQSQSTVLSDVVVNLVESGHAVVTLGHRMQPVRVGDVVAGHVVVALSEPEGSITFKAPSGQTQKRQIDWMASRQLPRIQPLGSGNNTQSGGLSEPPPPAGLSDFIGLGGE